MRKILDEISILPGVAGSCIFSKEDGPLCADHQLTIDKEAIQTMGTHLVRLLQMSKMVGFDVRTAKFKFDAYTVVGMSIENDTVLMTICEPHANCSLVATSAGMLVDDIRKDLAQGITLNVDDVKEVMEVELEPEQEEAGIVVFDQKTSDVLDQIEQELSGIIGPVAEMVVTEYIDDLTVNGNGISSFSKLINLLASEIDDSSTAIDFKSTCYELSKEAGIVDVPQSPDGQDIFRVDVSNQAESQLDSKSKAILKQIEAKLVSSMGPMAKVMVQDHLSRQAVNGSLDSFQLRKLINNLAREITDPSASADFKSEFNELNNSTDISAANVGLQMSSTGRETNSTNSITIKSAVGSELTSNPSPSSGSGSKVVKVLVRGKNNKPILDTPEVDSSILRQIELSLAQVMGPFAGMLMEENISKWKKNGPPATSRLPELIETIREDINDPTQALAFNARVNTVLENVKILSE